LRGAGRGAIAEMAGRLRGEREYPLAYGVRPCAGALRPAARRLHRVAGETVSKTFR